MELDARTCYRALETRDRRFDGRFFVGVLTTRVYCRPVCPARTPKRANVRFFACAATAQEAGFRPCLRCRPESAPGSPAWRGTSSTVQRALRLIAEGALDAGDAQGLAARLGIGERHLRRLFARHLGTTPGVVAVTRRVHFAKQLLDETDLGMAHVARAAGFPSVRRFNAAIRATYGMTPTALRKRPSGRAGGDDLELSLSFRPPYAWDALLDYLRPRATPGVERVAGNTYARTFALGGERGVLTVAPADRRDALRVRIQGARPHVLLQIVARLRRMFDLDADPHAIADQLANDRRLARSVAATPGLRLPGAWDGFELAVRAVLGQQVSVRAATTLAGRLAARYGSGIETSAGLDRVFPDAAGLADVDLVGLGLPRRRAGALRALARAVTSGDVRFDGTQDTAELRARLLALDGFGDWTCEYIAMRALHEPDAFPAGDLGVRRALTHDDPRRGSSLRTPSAISRRAETWKPWRAYATFHLWREEADRATRNR